MTDQPAIDPNSDELSDLLAKWHEAKQQADQWKTTENMLRLKIFGGLFPNPEPGPKNKVRLPFNMALIGDYRINYTIDQPAMLASRSLIEPATFEEVISWTPKVREAKFRDLDPEVRRPFTTFITAAPGTPGIELKPADKVRW
jgi:hypothetical protein